MKNKLDYLIEIKRANLVEHLKKLIKSYNELKIDISDYSESNICKLPLVNKKILGKFKNELNGEVMTKFVGFRLKLY